MLAAPQYGSEHLAILAVISVAVGAALTLVITKVLGGQAISAAKREAEQIVTAAQSEAQTLKKQAELDTRNSQAKLRDEFEKETEAARNEIKEAERRVTKREDNLDRKLDMLTTKEKYLDDLDIKLKNREKQEIGRAHV